MDVLEKDRNRVLPFPKNVTVALIVEIKSIKETHQANRRGKILLSNLDWQFKLYVETMYIFNNYIYKLSLDTGLKSRMKRIELSPRRKASKKKVAMKAGAKKAK